MKSLVTALPGLVPIFVSAGGVNALAGVLFYLVVHNHRWIFIFFTGSGAITLFSALQTSSHGPTSRMDSSFL